MHPQTGRKRNPLRGCRHRGSMCHMMTSDERLVIVRAKPLDDALELARLAVERLGDADPIARELRGAIAEVRSSGLMEP